MSNHSDDIVTRLREIADADVYRADISVSKLYEAADEIERLRKLTSELASMMLPFLLLMNNKEQEKVMKAVRGE